MPLPVPHEVGRGGLPERQGGDTAGLIAVGHAAVIFPPGRLLSVAEEIGARDVVMVPGLGAAKAAEILLRHVRAGAGLTVGLGMVDPLHLESRVQGIPTGSLIGLDDRARDDTGLDPVEGGALRPEHGRDRQAVALAHDDDGLPLAVLVDGEATVPAVLLVVRGLLVATEIGAVDLGSLALAADDAALHFFRHGLAQLVGQDEGGLVGHAEVAGERQGGLALHLVAEDRDGAEVHAERQLVGGEQGARGDGEVLAALAATEAQRPRRTAALVGVQATALGADRGAVGVGPADRAELGFGLEVRHAEHGGEAQRLGGAGEEEVLSQGVTYRFR